MARAIGRTYAVGVCSLWQSDTILLTGYDQALGYRALSASHSAQVSGKRMARYHEMATTRSSPARSL